MTSTSYQMQSVAVVLVAICSVLLLETLWPGSKAVKVAALVIALGALAPVVSVRLNRA